MAKAKKAATKDEVVRLRLTVEQKRVLTIAAKKAGLSLSSWLLALALREAKR